VNAYRRCGRTSRPTIQPRCGRPRDPRAFQTLSGYVQELANYSGGQIPGRVIQKGDIVKKVLEVVLPKGNLTAAQQEILLKIHEQAARSGVEVIYFQAR
jgi:hypothetical protein